MSLLLLSAFGFLALTAAPDIEGTWKGDEWRSITLQSAEEANDWYSGTFVDSDGRRGAIHLEWSGLRRRFDGRWSIGSGYSGTIVLRTGNQNRVRGAILVDAEVQQSADEVRLRDFEWALGTPSSAGTSEAAVSTKDAGDTRIITTGDFGDFLPAARTTSATRHRETAILSPVDGTIKEVGSRVRVGEILTAGELIVELEVENLEPLRAQLQELEEKLKSSELKANVYAQTAKDYEAARDFAVKAADELANAARAKYRSKASQIQAYQAAEKQARLNYERIASLRDQSIASEQDARSKKTKWEVAIAELRSVESDVEMLESEWKVKQNEREEKKHLAQTKIDQTKSQQQEAVDRISRLRREIEQLETRLADAQVMRIQAPADVEIVGMENLQSGSRVRQGDQIIQFRRATGGHSPAASSLPASQSFSLGSVPAMMKLAADLNERIRVLMERLQTSADDAARIESEIKTYSQQLERLKSDSKPQADQKNLLQSELNLHVRMLNDLKSRRSKESSKLDLVHNELRTTIGLLELERESKKSELKSVQESLEMLTLRFENGDITRLELQPSELRLRQVQMKVAQLDRLLEYFQSIGKKVTPDPAEE